MEIEKSKLREKIEKLYFECDFDAIGKLPGFTIIERRVFLRDRKNKYACVGWVFERNEESAQRYANSIVFGKMPYGFTEVEKPSKGDFVNYLTSEVSFGCTLDYEPRHLGIYVGNNRVRSKFAEGHVYEHDISSVPLWYGDKVTFFRKIK